jgi:hypothetical protein
MDFEVLYGLLPKPSLTWTVTDIETWLDFIGLSSYAPQFSTPSFTQKQPPSTAAA